MHSSTISQELYLNHIQFQPSDVTRFSATALQRGTAEERVGGVESFDSEGFILFETAHEVSQVENKAGQILFESAGRASFMLILNC